MDRIDAHQHFWKYSKKEYAWISDQMSVLQKDFLASNLEPLLKNNGFSGCIAVQARQSEKENDFLLEEARSSTIVKGIVGWTDLRSYQLGEALEKWSANKEIVGFRHIVQDEEDPNFLLGMEFVDGIKMLDLFNYTYDLLIYERQMPQAIRFLDKLSGQQKIVLDHIGKPLIKERLTNNWKDSLKEMAKYPELSIKISGLVTEAKWEAWDEDTFKPYLDLVVEAFGPDRIMVGSDWPVCLLAADSYSKVIDITSNYFVDFSEEDKAKIFGRNCSKFYNVQTTDV